MDCKEILKLSEGTHVIMVDGCLSMIIRLKDGFTMTRTQPEAQLLIQRYSESGELIREDKFDNDFVDKEAGK